MHTHTNSFTLPVAEGRAQIQAYALQEENMEERVQVSGASITPLGWGDSSTFSPLLSPLSAHPTPDAYIPPVAIRPCDHMKRNIFIGDTVLRVKWDGSST